MQPLVSLLSETLRYNQEIKITFKFSPRQPILLTVCPLVFNLMFAILCSFSVRLDARNCHCLTLKVLVATTDAQWEGMGDVGSARYESALLPPRPTIRVLSYRN